MSNYLEEHGYRSYLYAAEKTLKPCPLCGGKPIYTSGIHNGYDYEIGTVCCDGCGLELRVTFYGYGEYDPLHAFDAWNNRPDREVGISELQKITKTNYLTAKSILESLADAGAKVVRP